MDGEFTIEQKQAIAIASARARMAKEKQQEPAVAPKAEASLLDKVAGSSPVRLATGALGPLTMAFQAGANVVPGTGAEPINEALDSAEASKRRGMDWWAERQRKGREGRAAAGAPDAPTIEEALASLMGSEVAPMDAAGVAGSLMTGSALVRGMPATAKGLERIVQGAKAGAVLAPTTSPVLNANDEGYWGQQVERALLGGTLGATVPFLWEGAKLGGRIGRNVVDVFRKGGAERAAGRLANKVASAASGTPGRDAVVQALSSPRQIVPGSVPNAGQAAAATNNAEFVGLQDIAAKNKPSQYFGPGGREGQQEAARLAAVRTVGQTPADLAAAVASRKAASTANYGAAFQQQIKADPDLLQMADNPFFKAAIPDAFRLAQAKGINPQSDLTEFLHYVKISLDKQLRRTGDTALSSTEKRVIADLQDNLVKWIGKKNPAYEFARASHQTASAPIAQMKLGQDMEKALISPMSGAERPASFANALQTAGTKIDRATNAPRMAALSGQQTATLGSVGEELKRDAVVEALARQGAPAARKIVGEASEPVARVNLLNRVWNITNSVLARLEGKGTKVTMDALSDMMLDPPQMARIMQAATPYERSQLLDAVNKLQGGLQVQAAQGD